MKTEKTRKSVIRKTAAVAACFAAFTISLNASSSFAYAMSKIPVIDSIVRVLTLDKYEVKEDNYEATVVTPQIEGLVDEELQEKINNDFKENAQQVIVAFEKSIKELNAEYGEGNFHDGIEYNYEVKTDNENTLALDVYLYGTSGSSWVEHTYYNIDKKTGELVEFKKLFKDNADYVTPISNYIKEEIVRRNAQEDGMYFVKDSENPIDGFEKIDESPKFYINNDGKIVICFDKYEIAAGAQGSPEFIIPDEVIADIVK